MKLNHDCVRDVLLTVEDRPFNTLFRLRDLTERLGQYTADEIAYCCLKLNEAGLLKVTVTHYTGNISPSVAFIKDITFTGHEFLDKIRDDSVWTETKNKAKSVGTFALDVLSQIAGNIISSRIGIQ